MSLLATQGCGLYSSLFSGLPESSIGSRRTPDKVQIQWLVCLPFYQSEE